MPFEQIKRPHHSILRPFLISLIFLGGVRILHAEETSIEKLQSYQNAIVTVKGQVIVSLDESEKPKAALAPNGQIVVLDNHRVQVQEKTGAGVIVDQNGTIVTNTHIIYGSQVIKVVLNDGTELPAAVLFVSREYDFSLLKIVGACPQSHIEWGDSDRAELGQEIITIGHSPLLDKTISGGIIRGMGTRTLKDGKTTPELLELNINHYAGDSGGPVFDREGRFLGLIEAKRLTVDRACFAVPVNKIHSAYLSLADDKQNK